jgi:hypothetical protein
MEKAEIVDYIIKSRSDRDAVEVGNWAKHKKTFYSERYILFYLQADHKKNNRTWTHLFIFFYCPKIFLNHFDLITFFDLMKFLFGVFCQDHTWLGNVLQHVFTVESVI